MDVGPSNCDTMGQSGGPNPLIDKIVAELKSQGLFDQLRKECMADVDTKPAYQNLRQRVENTVSDFLHVKKWKPDLAKNKLRDSVRQHMFNMQMLDNGIERIINQAISPKVYSSFVPQVEDVVCSVLGIEKPNKDNKRLSNGVHSSCEDKKKILNCVDLLPTDLDPISPEKFDDSDDGGDLVIAKQEASDEENEPRSENCDADISFDAVDSSPMYRPVHGDESPTLNCTNDTDAVSADSTMDSFFAVKSVCKTVEESSEADAKNEIMETRSISHTSSISNDDLMIEESTQMNSPDSVEKDLTCEDDNKKQQVDVESSEIEEPVAIKEEKTTEECIPDNSVQLEDEKVNETEKLSVDKIEDKHDENKFIVETKSHKSSDSSKGKDSKSQDKTHRSSTKHDAKHSSREKSSSDKSSRGHSSSRDRSHTSNRDDKKKDDRRSSSSKREDSKSKSDRTKDDKRRDRSSRTDDHKSDSSKKHESKKYSKDSHGEKQRQSDKDRSSNSTHSHRSEKRSEKSSKSEEKSKDNESSTSSSASPSQDSVNQKSHSTQDKSESRHKNKDQDSSKTEKNGRDSKKSDDKYKNKTRDSELTRKESNIEQHEETDLSESLDIFEDAEVIDFNDVNENSKLKLIEYEENKFKRPKIAENFHEIRKIMRLRKNLNRLDKLKQKRLLSEDVKLDEQKPVKEEEQPSQTNEEHESEDRAAKRLVIDDSKHLPEISEKPSTTVSGPSVQETKDEILFFENSKGVESISLQDVLLEGDGDSCASNDCVDTSDGSDDDSLVSLEFNEVDYTALVLDHPEFLDKDSSATILTRQQQAEDKDEICDVKSTANVSNMSNTYQPESPYQGDLLAKENNDAVDFVKDETPIVKKETTKKRQQSFDCSSLKAKPQVPEKRFMLTPPKEDKNINHIEKKQVFDSEDTNSKDSVVSMPDEQNEITVNGHEDGCKSPPEAKPPSSPSFPAKPLQPLQQGQEETDSEKQTLSRGRPKRVQTPRGVSAKQQRYDSSDLYKPRLSFASTRRLRESTTAAASGRNARNAVHTPERK